MKNKRILGAFVWEVRKISVEKLRFIVYKRRNEDETAKVRLQTALPNLDKILPSFHGFYGHGICLVPLRLGGRQIIAQTDEAPVLIL